MKAYFQRLFHYNEWAYKRLEDHIVEYGFEHLEVFKLLSHCHNAERIWLNRIESRDEKVEVWKIYDLKDLFQLLASSNKAWNDFLKNEQDFERTIQYTNSKEDTFESVLSDIVAHVANHGTHHRAQVSALLRKSGNIPPATDFIFFSRD